MQKTPNATIKQWALEDRPREKMIAQGAESLSKAELLAILIGSGIPGLSAVALMRQVLRDYDDSLKLLGRATVQDLCRYRGMGEAKAVTVLAACQLAQRRLEETVGERQTVTCSRDIYEYFLPRMQDLSHEECHVLLLRHNHTIIASVLVGRGGITDAPVDIRIIMQQVLRHNATAIALCHNHPSGSVRPSQADNRLTQQLGQACKVMGINLLDHIVLADGDYYSYCDEGQLM